MNESDTMMRIAQVALQSGNWFSEKDGRQEKGNAPAFKMGWERTQKHVYSRLYIYIEIHFDRPDVSLFQIPTNKLCSSDALTSRNHY